MSDGYDNEAGLRAQIADMMTGDSAFNRLAKECVILRNRINKLESERRSLHEELRLFKFYSNSGTKAMVVSELAAQEDEE